MLKYKCKVALMLSLVTVTIYANDRDPFDPIVVQRFRVKDLYLGMTIDELRDITDDNKHHVFRDCKEKRNFDFGYMYCSNKEAGFRFNKNGRLTRFWFGINQAEKIFGKKFKSQKDYAMFVKSIFHIKSLYEHNGKPQSDSQTGKPIDAKIYFQIINRVDYLEINEKSILTIGDRGGDARMRID